MVVFVTVDVEEVVVVVVFVWVVVVVVGGMQTNGSRMKNCTVATLLVAVETSTVMYSLSSIRFDRSVLSNR